jgi:molecular chaperone IbpA
MTKQNFPSSWAQIPQLKDIEKFFVGFDEQVNRIQKLHADVTGNIPNYPPCNIRKTGDNAYTVELAVAGFNQTDIDIEIDGGKLIVRGNVSADTDANDYVFRGIANRAFARSFLIDDQFEVRNAEMFNGMLKIALERLVPEETKPKKVPIKTRGEKSFLTEEEKDEIASKL